MDDGGEGESDHGEAEGAHQRDDQAQVGEGEARRQVREDDGRAYEVLVHELLPLRDLARLAHLLQLLVPDGVKVDVVHEAVRDEDGQRHHEPDALGWDFDLGEVEGDAGVDGVPVLQVAEQADADEEHHDGHHGAVQHAEAAAEVLGVLHLVLERDHHSHGLQREHGRAEEEREVGDVAEGHPVLDAGDLPEHVVQDDGEAAQRDGHGESGEGRQVLEVADPAQHDDGDGDEHHVDAEPQPARPVPLHDRLHVARYEDDVRYAGAHLVGDHECVDGAAHVLG